MNKLELLCDIKNTLGEGPYYDYRNGNISFIDIVGKKLFILDKNKELKEVLFNEKIGAAIPIKDSNGFLVFGETKVFLYQNDEIKEDVKLNLENKKNKILEQKESEEENPFLKKLNINISSIVPIREMQVMDGIIFACASVFYKETKLKTNRMLKIIENDVIDEYTMFNNYYDFIIMRFSDKPLLIVFGSMKKMTENFNQVTSIKFYNASYFIEKRTERYPVKQEVSDVNENYQEILTREIKLYKKGNTQIICEAEGNKSEGLNNLEKCFGFTIDSTLSFAAIGLDKGEIAIISGFPNLLDCKGKKLKSTLVNLPEKGGENLDITNIKFGELYMGKNEKKILYVSTKNFLTYYEWNYDEKGIDDLDNNIQCKIIQNINGVHEGCLFVKNNSLLIATSDNKYIYEYSNCKLNKLEKDEKGFIKKSEKGKRNGELAFEGEKKKCYVLL